MSSGEAGFLRYGDVHAAPGCQCWRLPQRNQGALPDAMLARTSAGALVATPFSVDSASTMLRLPTI